MAYWKRWKFVIDSKSDAHYVIVEYLDGSFAARLNDGWTFKTGTLLASCNEYEDALEEIKSKIRGPYKVLSWRDD